MKHFYTLFIVLGVCSLSLQETTFFNSGAITVNHTNCGARTHFVITAPIQNGVNINASWLGLTLDTDFSSYAGANLIACKKNGSTLSVEHYAYSGSNLVYMNATNKFTGLNSLSITTNGNMMTCKFTRENKDRDPMFLNMNTQKLFMKISYGSLSGDAPQMAVSEYPSPSVVNFPVTLNCEQWTSLDNDQIMVKFRNYGSKTMYEATAVIGNNVNIDNVWLGVGINLNRNMPGASVVVCKRTPTFNSVEHYYNDGLTPKYINDANKFEGLSSMYVSASGNILTCRFTRDNRNTIPNYIYQSGENLYVIVSYGSYYSNDTMAKYSLIEESKNIVSFPIQPSIEDYTTLDNENLRVDFKNCGSMTHFTVTAVIRNNVNMNNVWVGMGLNVNRKMPGADVVVCKRGSNFTSVEHYYNDNLTPKYMNSSNKYEGLSSMSVSVNGNVLTCKFSRDNSNPNPYYKNLNTEALFIDVAYGPMNGEEILGHVLVKITQNIVKFPVAPRCTQFTSLNDDKIRIEFKNYGQKTDFIATAVIENGVDINNAWLGIGLNQNRKMPGRDVVMCKRNNYVPSVEHYYNDNTMPSYINDSNPFVGLSSSAISVVNNVMTCKFTRDNSYPDSKYKNLNTESLFLDAAYGKIVNNQLQAHVFAEETKNVVNFPVEPISQDYITLDNDKLKVEFTNCGQITHFKVTALIENGISMNNVWVGMGLNVNRKMPGADVVVCKRGSNFTSVEHYYNDNLTPKYMNSSNKYEGLSSMSVSVNGNVLTCKFSRDNSNPNPYYKNLNTEALFIDVAYGPMNGEEILGHVLVKITQNIVKVPVSKKCDDYTTLDNDKIIVKYKNYGTRTEFIATAVLEKVDINSVYLAVGLNLNRKMPYIDYVACKKSGSQTSVEHYYNDNFTPVYLSDADKTIGLTKMELTTTNNTMTCRFFRENSNSNPRYLNINTQALFIIAAYGPLFGQTIGKHVNVIVTKNIVSFPVKSNETSKSFILGDYSVQWVERLDEIDFVFSTNVSLSNNLWTSLALSTDRIMGDDNAIVCKAYASTKTIEHYYNSGKFRPNFLSELEPSVGISNMNVQLNNGVLTCSFSRQKKRDDIQNYFDTRSNYFFLFAKGPTDDNGLLASHVGNKMSSSTLFDLQSGKLIEAPTTIAPIPMTTSSPIIGYIKDEFSLYWTDDGDKTNFTFSTKLTSTSNIYSSFAFSKDYDMGDDDVNVCKITSSGQTVERYYNQGKIAPALLLPADPKVGLSNIVVTLVNGTLICSFTRIKKNANVSNYFDLSNPYYVLFARGSLDANGLKYHENRVPGSVMIDFTKSAMPVTSAPNRVTKPKTGVIASGNFSSGNYQLTWNETQYYTYFSGSEGSATSKTNRAKRQSGGADRYLAFGLSLDKLMGSDCIVVCKMSNNVGTVEHYYSTGKFTPGLLDPNEPTIGITDATVSYVNGNLVCSFTREKYIEGVSRYCDSKNNKYYLQIVKGSVSGGIIQYHGSSIVVSDAPIDFSVNGTFSGSTRDSAKSKAHACLMLFAWLFCVYTGIILARYYKYILPSIKIQKMMIWFQAHRALMIFTPICSIAAFLVILADLDWKWVTMTSKTSFAHSIFGIVAIGLSFIQIIMGFLRPDKDAPRRPLFNVMHRFTGMSTVTLAVIACFLGVFIERMNLGRVGWGLMIGWTMWSIVLPLLIELVQVLCAKRRSDSYQVTTDMDKMKPEPSEGNKKLVEGVKSALLILHFIISLGHVIALIVIIGIAEPNKYVSD